MELKKLFFILSLIGILFLLIISQTTTQTYLGKIKSIQPSNNKVTLIIENSSTELILFETNFIKLKKGDTIEFQGKKDIYKNKKQIIISKISLCKTKC